jgi:hypothetical protein
LIVALVRIAVPEMFDAGVALIQDLGTSSGDELIL